MQYEDLLIREIQKIGLLIAAMISKRKEGFAQESVDMSAYLFRELLPEGDFKPPLQMNEDAVRALSVEKIDLLERATYETAKSYRELGQEEQAATYFTLSHRIHQIKNEVTKTYSFQIYDEEI